METPFYLYDIKLLRATLEHINEAASEHNYKVHYAIKANFEPEIVDIIREYGLGVDCVSGNEVRYVIDRGFSASSIVYAGVGKTDKEIRYAVEQGIFAFNCESRQELEVINTIAKELGRTADVALRINPDVDPLTHKHISTGQGDSKFGISYKEIDEVIESIDLLGNINITGIHFHIGSQITELRVFEYLCLRVNTLYQWFREKGFKFTHINVGGGLGIDYTAPETNPIPDFRQYFSIFKNTLKLDPDIEIHFELGRSIVGQCGELISRVLFNKVTSGGKNVAILDASMTELMRPALYEAYHAIENLDANATRTPVPYIVAGTVCESTDTFAGNIVLPELRRGDLVTIKSTGAYGTAMASRYNLHDLPRSVFYNE